MDATKALKYARVVSLLALALVLPTRVQAQEPPPADEGGRINTAGVTSGQLPAPLPEPPPGISLPDLSLPVPDASSWPSTDGAEQILREDVEGVVGEINGVLTSNYAFVLGRIYDARRITNQINQVIGEEEAGATGGFGIQSTDGTVTATSLATDLAGSIRFTMAYLRAISGLGPLGLDLVFVFVGLGWIVLVNLADMAIRLAAWVIGIIGKVLGFVWKIIEAIFLIVNLILRIVEIIWPF